MRDTWGFIDTGILDAKVNMAMDEMLLHWHSEGKIPPILRFYQWAAPSLSIGYFQKVDKAIDEQALDRYGVPLVRRLTGGSAVLHDDELTYSITLTEDKPYIPASVGQAYYILSKGVFAGYENLGMSVEYAETKKFDKNRSAVCFEKPALYELMANGKKISGNAQTRQKGVLLQHGSIPRTIDRTMLFDLFKFSNERVRERSRKSFDQKATTIHQELGQSVSVDAMKTAFKKGFETGVNIELVPFELTSEQWAEVYQLAEEKYGSLEWNFI
ncbi:lipoate--protein ligase family protein [Bacillaceae bacterium SIJ1]|uniref:lipoate--protein ligase family protein n=1 Tax=Litoribacterium kuwaitense TaxID=1398745 RepID=UPI0013EBD5B1|nr:lipoate--protein ligase family protein [Litoribacterium kuwaitense]NGP44592.1 lipoate--protein ligase family protein [Litoribacterium kuwaitense]